MNVSPVFNVPVKVHEIEIGPALKYIMNAVLRIWNGCRIVQHAVFQPDNCISWPRQIGVKPPLFSFQINRRELMHFSYSRYLENRIRESFGFEGTSIKFIFREKGDSDDFIG